MYLREDGLVIREAVIEDAAILYAGGMMVVLWLMPAFRRDSE